MASSVSFLRSIGLASFDGESYLQGDYIGNRCTVSALLEEFYVPSGETGPPKAYAMCTAISAPIFYCQPVTLINVRGPYWKFLISFSHPEVHFHSSVCPAQWSSILIRRPSSIPYWSFVLFPLSSLVYL